MFTITYAGQNHPLDLAPLQVIHFLTKLFEQIQGHLVDGPLVHRKRRDSTFFVDLDLDQLLSWDTACRLPSHTPRHETRSTSQNLPRQHFLTNWQEQTPKTARRCEGKTVDGRNLIAKSYLRSFRYHLRGSLTTI